MHYFEFYNFDFKFYNQQFQKSFNDFHQKLNNFSIFIRHNPSFAILSFLIITNDEQLMALKIYIHMKM